VGVAGDLARCQEAGISGYLQKPVRQSELLRTIRTVMETAAAPQSPAYLPRAAALGDGRLRILLAEDNRVNQLLAVRLLEKRGHEVTVVNNGREALEALDREIFDLVLMDMQMPEMDGFEATASIRRLEQATGRHMPIIAMTAHAMKGDEEKCLEAGLDGYLSKPIDPDRLYETVRRAPALTAKRPAGN